MQIEFQSDVGNKRKNNQDFAGVFKNKNNRTLVVVADGMGGHQAGDVASKLAVTALGEKWEETTIDQSKEATDWLHAEVQKENDVIYGLGEKESQLFGMGTTLVMAIILDEQFVLAHIGDSRAYLYDNNSGEINQLTEDHSLVNELVKQGEISPEEARNHPRKNVITRTLGVAGRIELDISYHTITSNKRLYLFSDGITNMVTDEEIEKIIAEKRPLTDEVSELIKAANLAGGLDNSTVLVVTFEGEEESA